jgi:hypothetical protein
MHNARAVCRVDFDVMGDWIGLATRLARPERVVPTFIKEPCVSPADLDA